MLCVIFFFPLSDIFSLGFGPFRWVCTSGDPADLAVTDNITLQVLDSIVTKGGQFHIFIYNTPRKMAGDLVRWVQAKCEVHKMAKKKRSYSYI